jgi:predicted O-methyltransferase YrrM
MNTFLAKKFLEYKLKAKDEHSVHSPFVFDLYCNVIRNKDRYYAYDELKKIRDALEENETELEIEDLGAGSKHFSAAVRKVSAIAQHGVTKEKYSSLLFRLAEAFQSKTILELGTSIGLNTLYLASANKNSKVITFEGSHPLCNFAQSLFKSRSFKNIELVEGNFDETFSKKLNTLENIDLLFIDGNHRKVPTLNYFKAALQKTHNDSIIILDDIYWSSEMEETWNEIKELPEVKITIDLFQFGIVFFRKEHKQKENYILKF